jgi:hypothetical protein
MLSGNKLVQLITFLLIFSSLNTFLLSQVVPKNYSAELAAARKQVIEIGPLEIHDLDLGPVTTGKNTFHALVKNRSEKSATIGLDLRAQPGLWFRNWQNQFVFHIGPGEEREIHSDYLFFRLTEEATLRVRFGVPTVKEGGGIEIRNNVFEKKYSVGIGNKSVDYDLSRFEHSTTEHFEIYCFKRSLASEHIDEIRKQRETGYQAISRLLDTTYHSKIRLFFFPDAQTKTAETGHTGDGWAVSDNIIEIYSEETKLDPFHEVAHIIAGELGEPPALLIEGFAVYVSERLGADALKYLGSPGKTIYETVKIFRKLGTLIPIDTMLTYTDIGPVESRPRISYPEAASFVKHIFESFGAEKFRRAYRMLRNGDDPGVVAYNGGVFKEIFGKSIPEVEQDWLRKLR